MKDIKAMTDEELEEHVQAAYGRWMYHEAAERGYDFASASAARREYSAAKAEVEWRRCRSKAGPLVEMIDTLVGGSEA